MEAIKKNAAINGGQVTPTELQNLIKQVTDRMVVVDGQDRRLCRVEDLIKERRMHYNNPLELLLVSVIVRVRQAEYVVFRNLQRTRV